jgi:ubiquinone/menaquinone biosynthesis C-methylase UbiE
MTRPPSTPISKPKTHDPRSLEEKAQEQLEVFLADCEIKNVSDKSLLEIGFKNGLFLNACQVRGLKASGTEIRSDLYDAVKEKFPDLDLLLCTDQTIPLPDQSVDYIVSFQVLEHVGSLETILGECIRLLKPGGTLYHICPNYASFYEGHYKVLWLPFLSRRSGRFYLKLLGKYTSYYETLNIVKPALIRRLLAQHRDQIKILFLGKTEFVKKFSEDQIAKIDQKALRIFFQLLHKLPRLKTGCLNLIASLGCYYPLTIIVQKDP